MFDALGYDCKSHITYHINRNLLEEDCCIASFLRGAFLMGGTVAGPDKKSHLELKTTHQSLSGEETSLMLDLGLSPKQARRGSAYLLYFKDGASAEDFLTRIGAPHAAMELMQAKVEKNLRNTIDQYTMPGLEPLTKFGVFKARFNDVLTDSMRALKLEAEGYKVSVVEYISPLDTPKNLLIRATRTGKVNHRAKAEYDAVRRTLGTTSELDRRCAELDNEFFVTDEDLMG